VDHRKNRASRPVEGGEFGGDGSARSGRFDDQAGREQGRRGGGRVCEGGGYRTASPRGKRLGKGRDDWANLWVQSVIVQSVPV
jgi:hypothetical protein